MVFAVVVEVPPVEAATAARTIATCNAALGPEQCVLSGPNPASDPPAYWYAVVRYADDGQARLSIELYAGNRAGSRIASSELEFKPRDSEQERWASAGVVVAALVLAQPLDRARPETPPESMPKVPSEPRSPKRLAPAKPPPWLRLELGASVGSETPNAPLRVGPLARLGLAFAGIPVFALSSAAYTVQSSGSTDLSWITGSLGAGVGLSFARERAALEFRTEVVIETLGIRATDGARSESARRTRCGPRFGLDVSGYWAKNWALVLGAEAGVLGPRVVIDALGQSQELPPFVWGVLSSVRHDFR